MCRSVQAKGTFPGHACRTPRGARPLPDKRIRPPGTPAAAGSRAHRRSERRNSHHRRAWRREHVEGIGASAPPENPAARMLRPWRRIAVVRPRGVSFAALPVAPLSGNAPGGSAPCRAKRSGTEARDIPFPKGRGMESAGAGYGRADPSMGVGTAPVARRALGRRGGPAAHVRQGQRAQPQRPASKLPCGAMRGASPGVRWCQRGSACR